MMINNSGKHISICVTFNDWILTEHIIMSDTKMQVCLSFIHFDAHVAVSVIVANLPKTVSHLNDICFYVFYFSDYMSFMKKSMVLMKNYLIIKRVELEVQQVSKVQTPEASPNVSKSWHL